MAAQSTLVPVFSGSIAGHIVQLCDARALHVFLQVRRDFSNWIKGRIQKFGFLLNEDFITIYRSPNRASGNRGASTDYHLTLDMAKELAMVENNEQGRVVRRYFIECERRALQAPEQTTSHRPTTFHFDKNCIRVLTYHGKPWFVAKDLVPVLGYIDIMEMANHLRHDEHRSVLGYYSLSEFGLYSAIIESDSPDADRFQRWITSKVIPTYQPVPEQLPEPEFAIRQLDGLYSLKDLHVAAGGSPLRSPIEFKRRPLTKRFLAKLDERDSNVHMKRYPSLGLYICRELVLEYAKWVGDDFYLKIDSLLQRAPGAQLKLPLPDQAPASQPLATTMPLTSNGGLILDKIEQHIHSIHKLSYDYVSAIGEEADISYLANPKEIRYHERQLAIMGISREAIYSFFQRP